MKIKNPPKYCISFCVHFINKMNTKKCISEINLTIHSNEAMQFKSEFEKSQSFGVTRKQSEIVRVGMRVRRTVSKETDGQ